MDFSFKPLFVGVIGWILCSCILYGTNGRYSTAGFYQVEGSGRSVHNFNVGWRFHKGDTALAASVDFNDARWPVVSLPHTVQLEPSHASGSTNYQGVAWYRKRFTIPASSAAVHTLHFEGAMGKSRYYINGKLVKEHFGGFLPISIDLTKQGVKPGEEALISVWVDNSDDPIYPPGKPQYVMDFCYFGGLYRDCWLISTAPIYVTNANDADRVASGGVFVSYDQVSERSATINVRTQVANRSGWSSSITIENALIDRAGKVVARDKKSARLMADSTVEADQSILLKSPHLWNPDTPYLYDLQTSIYISGKLVDAQITRIGVRSIEFRAGSGLYINGVHFDEPLLGANRHQDYGYIGNALSNNLHYRDALLLRQAGLRIIRSAHYPQDPAFLDACDELGLFIIVATPGWQFWNPAPIFEQRIYSDIRNMVRRDRNHPSVLLWEPVLNETKFPESFALNAYNAVHQEYPAAGCYVACDSHSLGAARYDVIYAAPQQADYYEKLGKCCFTREWGDCVDDWNSHNSYSRVAREWGEMPQLRQAQHYARKEYGGSLTIDQLHKAPKAHVGGTLWHSFDHQRGYHPDPFYGGLMDAFRQPKYSYYMFQSQRDAALKLEHVESGPMIYIANEMTPFSSEDIVVYSNTDQVRLIIWEQDTLVMDRPKGEGIPSHPFVFKDSYSFVKVRALHRGKRPQQASIVAEGLIGGKVVVSTKKMPSTRVSGLVLSLEDAGVPTQANGSDVVTVIASVVDANGNIKRLSKERIIFEVEGEGVLISDERIASNPRNTEWGTAPALIRATTKAGTIRVIARSAYPGIAAIKGDTIEFTTQPSSVPLLYTETPTVYPKQLFNSNYTPRQLTEQEQEHLREVEREQSFFESTDRKDKR